MDESTTRLQDLDLTPCPVRYEVEYLAPAVANDQVQVLSRVVAMGETQLTWSHTIRRDEELLVAARATVCFEGSDGMPVPLPRVW